MVNSLLVITLRQLDDFGLYSCTVRNFSSDFRLDSSISKMSEHTILHMLGLLHAVLQLVYLSKTITP